MRLCSLVFCSALASASAMDGRRHRSMAERMSIVAADTLHDPANAKRVHHRLEVVVQPADDIPDDKHKYLHFDMEGLHRDTTVELDSAICSVDKATGMGTFQVGKPSAATMKDWDDAQVFVATCSNLDGRRIYGRAVETVVSPAGETSLRVNTKFKSEEDKLHAAYEWYTLQSYSGEVPIHMSKHLKYMQDLNADASTFYNDMNTRYRPQQKQAVRTAAAAAPADRRLQEFSADCTDTIGSNTECSSSASALVFNCDTISTSTTNPGCATFTDPSIAIIDDLVLEYGGTDFTINLSCEECSITIAGASVYMFVETTSSTFSWDAEYSVGAEINDAVLDWALLLNVQMDPSTSAGAPESYAIIDEFVPGLSISGSLFGVDVGAGLKFVVTTTPDITLEGTLEAQVGSKIILNAAVSSTGSVGTSGIDLTDTEGEFSLVNRVDAPRLTAEISGSFEQTYDVELQFGMWADAGESATAYVYAGVGVPVVFSGDFAVSTGLLSTIPDSFCGLDSSELNVFVGDCTKSNNMQAQLSIETRDPYMKAYAGVEVPVFGDFVFSADVDASVVSGMDLTLGPYTVTYCDCFLFDGVDCGESADGVCSTDEYPQDVAISPQYTANAVESGMDLSDIAGDALNGAETVAVSLGCLLAAVGAVMN